MLVRTCTTHCFNQTVGLLPGMLAPELLLDPERECRDLWHPVHQRVGLSDTRAWKSNENAGGDGDGD